MIKTVFFDLFFTLVVPRYQKQTEYHAAGLNRLEWEKYAEDAELYKERALGRITEPAEIIEKIVAAIPKKIENDAKAQILHRRQQRMKNALCSVDAEILAVLGALRQKGCKLCLISNADFIDCMFWHDSPLCPLFDEAVFSCNTGMLKPDPAIYRYSMELTGAKPQQSLFVGDGGSNELFGAKQAGMQTVFAEWFDQKDENAAKRINENADFRISKISRLIDIVDFE